MLAISVALIGWGVATGGGKGTSARGAGEIFLEPAAQLAPDPFTASVDTHNAVAPAPPTTTTTTPVTAPATTTTAPATVVTPQVQGVIPGLYGGTRDNSSCDVARLVAFLEANPSKAAAWAAVQGIAPAAIADYVKGLTPMLLRQDTRVTNHGFRNGRATPRQAVLQAGTAVLVDATGVPRAKCACGNPLAPPRPVQTTPRYTGTPWAGFTPTKVVAVAPAAPVDHFVLIDVRDGRPFTRPVASTGNADTNATLPPTTPPTEAPPVTTTATTTVTDAGAQEAMGLVRKALERCNVVIRSMQAAPSADPPGSYRVGVDGADGEYAFTVVPSSGTIAPADPLAAEIANRCGFYGSG